MIRYYLILLILALSLFSCEEKIEDLGDPKGVIAGNTTTYHKTVYASYDSLIQIDSVYALEGNVTSYGQYKGVNIFSLLRFFTFFPEDSLVRVKAAKLVLTTNYVYGEYPASIPLNFYEFTETWTTDTLDHIIDDNPDNFADVIFNMTGGIEIAHYDYEYAGPDTADNSRAEDDTIYVDIDPALIEKWDNDPDFTFKGLLLYPNFQDNTVLAFHPFGTDSRISFRLTYDYYKDGEIISVQDSIFPVSTDVTFFDGDYPQPSDPNDMVISSGRPQKLFLNFDYGTLPDRSVILFGKMVIPIVKDESLFSVARLYRGLLLRPLITDADGNLIESSLISGYRLSDISEENDQWSLLDYSGGTFASKILQPIYNGIRENPDSLYIKGFYLEVDGYMEDYTYYIIHGPNYSDKDLIPRIELEYFLPPDPRY
jgi:hypothetical protein